MKRTSSPSSPSPPATRAEDGNGLSETEQRFLHLFQDSVDPILFTDPAGIILEANKRAFDLLEASSEELIGSDIAALHAEDVLPDFSKLPEGSQREFDSELQVGENARRLHVRVRARRYTTESQRLVQWIYHDLSREVALEAQRQDLTAMLVHDLQGPLGNIVSSLEIVKTELVANGTEVANSMLDVALHSSQLLQALVNSLLDISRLEAGYPISKYAAVELSQLVNSVYEIEELEFEQRGVRLKVELAPDLPPVWADEDLLRRILLNLVSNALRHSRRDQAITVTARALQKEPMILVAVKDEGEGVPEQYRELIFEKFQRLEAPDTSKGLGLGLAFCRLAVLAHGGRIWVEDAGGGGACFCFTIPRAPASGG